MKQQSGLFVFEEEEKCDVTMFRNIAVTVIVEKEMNSEPRNMNP